MGTAFYKKSCQLTIDLVGAQMIRNRNNAGISTFLCHRPKVIAVEGDNQPLLLFCKRKHFRIRDTAEMKIVADIFDIKPAIEARKALTRRHVFIEKYLVFMKAMRNAGGY